MVGKVSFVSRSADPATRTFSVEMTVDNADLAIRDGETATIAIEAEGARAHLLSSSTLTLNDEGLKHLKDLTAKSADELRQERYDKFRAMGEFEGAVD